MRVKMKVGLSGSRDGQAWPQIGEVIDLPDDEAVSYLNAGMVEPAPEDDVETAVPSQEDVETRNDEIDLDALREQAKTAGVKVDKRWGADKLRAEIAAAQAEK